MNRADKRQNCRVKELTVVSSKRHGRRGQKSSTHRRESKRPRQNQGDESEESRPGWEKRDVSKEKKLLGRNLCHAFFF